MRSWFVAAGTALRLVADRAELWVPASLAALAFVGWLPLLLAVVPLPDAAGLAFFGSGLVTSGAWPWNMVLIAVGCVGLIVVLCVLVALGEAALQRGLRPVVAHPEWREPARRQPSGSLGGETAMLTVVLLVALLPAAIAITATALAVAGVAPGEFQSPDIGGPVLLRIARDVAPLLAVAVVIVALSQAYGAAVQRRATGPDAAPLGAALAAGFADLGREPLALLGTAVVSLAALTALTSVATVLLRVLWAPIGMALRAGDLARPQTVLLLVAFVAIWLCLVLAGGALHAWAAAWWSIEARRARREAGR